VSEDNTYTLSVRITGCGSAPNPVQEEVRSVLESAGYECTVTNDTERLVGESRRQRQDSLVAQLDTVRKLANLSGCYDAADFIRDLDAPRAALVTAQQLKVADLVAPARVWEVQAVERAVSRTVTADGDRARVWIDLLDPSTGETERICRSPRTPIFRHRS
jgi:hypothetical protein